MCELYTRKFVRNTMAIRQTALSEAYSLSNAVVGFCYVGLRNFEKSVEVAIQHYLAAVGIGFNNRSAPGLERNWGEDYFWRGEKFTRVFTGKYVNLTSKTVIGLLNCIHVITKSVHDMHFDGIHRFLSRPNCDVSRILGNTNSLAGAESIHALELFDVDQLFVNVGGGAAPMIGGQP